jgi:hypothetical protein
MEFIDILPEIIIMFIVGILAMISSVMSYKMYKKLPIKPYFYQSIALLFFSLFGLSMSLCLLFSSDLLLNFGILVFTISIMFYTNFFRELLGQYRKYEALHTIMGVFLGFIILIMIVYPLKIVEYNIEFNSDMLFLALNYVDCFFIIVVDYTIFSLRKIKKEHLSHKLSYFSITIIASMITTAISMYLMYLFSWNLVTPFRTQIIFIIIIFILLKKYPSFNFLALLNPLFLTVNHSSGLTIYTKQFQSMEMGDLLGGAVTAVNMLFKEVFVREEIEQIHFRGKVIYSTFRPQFSIIYIDDVYMPFISKVLNELADSISMKYKKELENFVGDINKFEGIEQEMSHVFYFLPQLM